MVVAAVGGVAATPGGAGSGLAGGAWEVLGVLAPPPSKCGRPGRDTRSLGAIVGAYGLLGVGWAAFNGRRGLTGSSDMILLAWGWTVFTRLPFSQGRVEGGRRRFGTLKGWREHGKAANHKKRFKCCGGGEASAWGVCKGNITVYSQSVWRKSGIEVYIIVPWSM